MGLPLSFHQGIVRGSLVSSGVPTLVLDIISTGGASGSPVIDSAGALVGLIQRVVFPSEIGVEGRTFVGSMEDLFAGMHSYGASELTESTSSRAQPAAGSSPFAS